MILLLRLAPLAVLLLGAAACGLTPATGPPAFNRGIGSQSGARNAWCRSARERRAFSPVWPVALHWRALL